MACARATNEGDGAKHLGSSRPEDCRDLQDEAQRSILVSYIPEGVNRDKLEIHFMRKSNGGSEIESITMVADNEAKITFLDGAAVETVLEKPHVLNGAEVKVQKWTPPEEKVSGTTEEDSRSIRVCDIPAGVSRDKLEIHFQRTSNGGGDIESITMVTNTEAKITFQDGAALETVLKRPQVLKGVEVRVHKWTPPAEDTKVGASATAVENSRSILVPIPGGVTVDELKIYFTEASNGGGEIESITMVTETVAIITYVESAAVKTVLGKQHALHGIQVTVQEYDDPEVFEEVHATVSADAADLIQLDMLDKLKLETGINWEKSADDDVIEVKGTFKQVEEAQQLLQQWLVQPIKDELESTNVSTTTVHKESSTTTDREQGPNGDARKTKSIKGKLKITGLNAKDRDDLALDRQSKRRKQSDEDHINLSTVSKDEGSCRDEWQRDGAKSTESPTNTASNQYASDPLALQSGNLNEDPEEESKGASSQKENTGELQMKQPTERGDDEGQPQQAGEQKEDAAKSSPAYEDTTSTSEEERLKLVSASGPSNEEEGSADKDDGTEAFKDAKEKPEKKKIGAPDSAKDKEASSRESKDKGNDAEAIKDAEGKPEKMEIGAPNSAKDIEASSRESTAKDNDTEAFKDALEEPEKMEMDEVPVLAQNKHLSDDDEPMPSDDDDDPQTQTSSNSSLPEEPKRDVPADPTVDAGNNDDHVPGDQSITRSVQDDPASETTDEDGDNVKPHHTDAQSPTDSTTKPYSQRDELPDNNDAGVTQPRGPKRRNKAFNQEILDKNGMPVDQPSSFASDTTGKLSTSKEHKSDAADCNAGSTGSDQQESSQFEVFVDPDVLTYIRHKHHEEISDIGKRHKSVFYTSDDNTKACFVPASPYVGKAPEPEKAMDEFTTIYQQVFSKITCENFDIVQYKLAPKFLLEGVRKVRQLYPEVVTKSSDDDTTVMFMGEPEKIREVRTAFCGIMGISIVSRGSRRRGNNPSTSTDPAGSSTDVPKGAEGGENSPVVLFTHTFKQGMVVKVAHGNITTLKVDAIVNAADGLLKHGGGVAKAIVQAGGYIIQEESTKKMKTRGFLKPTETEITGAGTLPCKNIIHAHGPKWQGDSQAKQCREMLKQTCINILQTAEGLKAESVAIPAISSGKYGMPKHVCAKALLSGVLDYVNTKHTPYCSLRNIWFIDMTEETIQVLAEVFATEISVLQSPSGHGKGKLQPTVKQNSRASQSPVRNPPQISTYASAVAKGNGKAKTSPASGPSHRNDSSQVAALIAPGIGPGCAQKVTQDRSSQQGKGGATGGGNKGTTGAATRDKSPGQPSTGKDKDDEKCPICLSVPINPRSPPCKAQGCKAVFCKKCLDKAMKTKSQCPVCSAVVGKLIGNQPEGSMKVSYNRQMNLAGYKQTGAIIIDYAFGGGIQGPEHPNPGQPYTGATRRAYLPYNANGKKVLGLLRQAFEQKLIFTIGTSSTTGLSDRVTWNDIHHKTSTYGGPSMHGYPDPGYLKRVTEEVAAKGIK
ncbi:uncharacterized protein LOC144877177 [Branchiostoma floridae x Branchiostoma japonicum]